MIEVNGADGLGACVSMVLADPPNKTLKLTGTAIPVSRAITFLQAAPAA